MADTEYRKAKRTILATLSQTLSMSQDIWPDEIPIEGPIYDAWSKAQDDLIREFDRRALGDTFAAPVLKGRAK